MKLGVVADVHIGNHNRFGGPVVAGINTRCQMTLDTLQKAVTQSIKNGVDAFVVAGDLFDTDRPSPQIVAATGKILEPLHKSKIECFLLLGNHDTTSTAKGDHALGPLRYCATVVEEPSLWIVDKLRIALVPYQPGQAKKWLPEALRTLPPLAGAVLCTHVGIIDQDTAPWLLKSVGAVSVELLQSLQAEYQLSTIYAGDWHTRKTWGNIIQVGALCPTGWDNPGRDGYGSLWIDLGKKGLACNIIPGPRFLKVDTDADPPVPNPLEFLSVASSNQEEADIMRLRYQGSACPGFEITDHAVDAQAVARSAYQVSGSNQTMQEAMIKFLDALQLDDEVRTNVQNRATEYLTRASKIA